MMNKKQQKTKIKKKAQSNKTHQDAFTTKREQNKNVPKQY